MVEKDLQKLVDLGYFLSFPFNCIDIGIDQTLESPHISTLNVPFKLGNEKMGLKTIGMMDTKATTSMATNHMNFKPTRWDFKNKKGM
jgi:hypothetical protein